MNEQGQAIPHRIFDSSWDFQQALSAMTVVLEECDFWLLAFVAVQ
ncbi:hypothetical protein [Marinobacter santoriniensis]|nr:hypothetical protein [Marinobacter santoriniensis]